MYFVRRMDEQYKYLGELLHPVAIETALLDYARDDHFDFSHAKVVIEAPKDSLSFCALSKEKPIRDG